MKIGFLNGPLRGQEFPVKEGLVLSRSGKEEGEVAIEDPKASNPHAKIVKKKGRFYLQDSESKNGTFFNDEINDYFILEPGVRFQIGQTLFQVKPPPPPKKFWPEIVTEELKKLSLKDQAIKLKPIIPALILTFKSGVQKGDQWHIHYGPREAGSTSLDLPILEPQAPDICFLLKPTKEFVIFKTPYPEKVLLNKKHISKKKLKDGDVISFINTSIEIKYDKNP
ncbi:MAG: FHA domain-containing protein [Bdellovibrionales bacterium]|nr:FHA domain-containing protein [Bdellovibrionales bacterium]